MGLPDELLCLDDDSWDTVRKARVAITCQARSGGLGPPRRFSNLDLLSFLHASAMPRLAIPLLSFQCPLSQNLVVYALVRIGARSLLVGQILTLPSPRGRKDPH